MMTSIDVGSKTSPEEMSDNISVKSDLSSDSESFVVVSDVKFLNVVNPNLFQRLNEY